MAEPAWLQRDVVLAPHCSMGVGGPARAFCRAQTRAVLHAACDWAAQQDLPVVSLGGGSNVVVGDDGIDALVLHVDLPGLQVQADGRVVCAAGESWERLVAATVAADLAGLECLSGIPGRVGAAPVQNIGAYGQQLGDVLQAVSVLDRARREVLRLPAAALGLGYRHSHFKGAWAQRFVILEVELQLRPGGRGHCGYQQVAAALGARPATAAAVRDAVLGLRQDKGMLLAAGEHNVGSFFVNPVIEAAAAAQLEARLQRPLRRLPCADASRVKLAAAWLLEVAGFARGCGDGAVGLSPRHALCLENRGGARAAEVLRFAGRLQQGVAQHTGVWLQLEPQCLGLSPAQLLALGVRA